MSDRSKIESKRKLDDANNTTEQSAPTAKKQFVPGFFAASAAPLLMSERKIVPRSEWRVKVAKYDYRSKMKLPHRSPEGYINVLIHVRDPLSPYVVRDTRNCILENVWQASKLYPEVTAQRIPKHRMRPNDIVWEHSSEVHATYTPVKDANLPVGQQNNAVQLDQLDVKPEYWAWRKKLEHNSEAVRYPNGFYGRHTCLGVLWPAKEGDLVAARDPASNTDYVLLPYVEARKRVYCGLYAEICKTDSEFARLLQLLQQGEKIQIWEVDGPSIEWGRTDSLYASVTARSPGLDMHNIAIVKKLLHDVKHSFGHGYTIAALLLHGESWLM